MDICTMATMYKYMLSKLCGFRGALCISNNRKKRICTVLSGEAKRKDIKKLVSKLIGSGDWDGKREGKRETANSKNWKIVKIIFFGGNSA